MKIYCSHCGTPHDYGVQKPNFCMSCGEGIGTGKQGSKAKTKLSPEEANEEEGAIEIPQLDGLEIEIQMTDKKKTTFGQIFEQAAYDDAPPQFENIQAQNISPDENQNLFQSEAGTLRPEE
mgnify:CR=1 FL=1